MIPEHPYPKNNWIPVIALLISTLTLLFGYRVYADENTKNTATVTAAVERIQFDVFEITKLIKGINQAQTQNRELFLIKFKEVESRIRENQIRIEQLEKR